MKFSFKKTWTVILTLLALTFSAIGVTPAHAASLTVNTLEDNTTNGDGLCTLREAITAANNNVNFNDCTGAGYGANTITFSVNGPILLGSQLPTITDAAGLTIDGTGQTVTISGNNAVRVMQVGAGASLTLNNLTIANGIAAGGGGIFNNGTATITNSTFSGNSAAGSFGAGIYTNSGTLTITNSTISGNSATGGFGAGVYNTGGGTVTLRNTILANNTSGGNCGGAININGGNNIDDGVTCGWGSAFGSKSSTPPLLGALANNGGPTQTFALLTGSPAIDGVTSNPPNSAPLTDQRGIPRPQGPRYDIGAFELDNTPPDTSIDSQNPATNPTHSTSMIFTFSGTDTGSGVKSFECDLDGGGFAACASPKSYASLADGSHTFLVRAIDFDGNVDASPASHTWTVDTTAPTVVSSLRANPSPTNLASVDFTVTFSEDVTGEDAADFNITITGPISGANVKSVTGGPTAYTVAVNTGTGAGTIRLDVPAGATVYDLAGNPLAGLPFTSGETYVVRLIYVYLPLALR